MLPIIFNIIQFIISILPSQESADTQKWNASVIALSEKNNCTEALKLYDKRDSLPLTALAKTRLKICRCLIEVGRMEEAKQTLDEFKVRKKGLFASSVWNERAVLTAAEGDTAQAIFLLRRAIETENCNTIAKYNYELLTKLYRPENSPKSQQNNLANQADRGGMIEESESKNDELQSTSPPEIGLAMALKYLDAMRANEFNKPTLLGAIKKDTANYGKW